jgi:hypothetical protein
MDMTAGSYLRAIHRIEARSDSPARAGGIVKAELGHRVTPEGEALATQLEGAWGLKLIERLWAS